MRKFILIDQSLRDRSGHHYPYATSILQAAADVGFRPLLASHESFSGGAALRSDWPRYPVFSRVSYSPYTLDTQLALPQRLRALRTPWNAWQRAQQAREFAAGLGRLFSQVKLNAGDVVFCATASELDCDGLTRYLAAVPAPQGVRWHLQLHFGIFRSRPVNYGSAAGTAAAARMRASLARSLRRVPGLQLYFHCTTDELCAQYNRLGLAGFHTLPYPVHALFSAPRQAAPARAPATRAPLRVACLGHARREKGHDHLLPLLEALWSDGLDSGRVELLLQSPKPPLQRLLRARAHELGNDAAVAVAPAAIDMAAYAELVRNCDIGVLLYDGLRYYDRCSGVLLELLAAGVPVVVPAACWLSRQIEAAEADYVARAHAGWQAAGRLRTVALPGSDIQLHPGQAVRIEAAMPADCPTLLFSCAELVAPADRGWLSLRVGSAGLRRVVPLPAAGATQRVLLRGTGSAGASVFELVLLHAREPVILRHCSLTAVAGAPEPLGALGLAVANAEEAAAGVRDILQHHAHYQAWARGFAAGHAARYSAAAVLRQLTGT